MRNIFKYISSIIFLTLFLIFILKINLLKDDNQIVLANILGLSFSVLGIFYSAIAWNKFMNSYNVVVQNSMLDGMTGLFTHKLFMERLESELGRASRHKENLTLLFLDLDKFKRINDTYGHLFGDLVIKDTATIIKNNVRTHDVVARYGGEEYAVILVNTSKEQCVKTVERIRSNIESHNYTNGEKEGVCKFFHENGQLKSEEYSDFGYGTEWNNGYIKNYYRNGQLKNEENWKGGELVSQKYWDEDGNETECE